METFAGVKVRYSRANQFSFDIIAVPGRNPVDMVDSEGLVLRGQIQDFTVNIVKLRDKLGDPKRPLRNDEIMMEMPFGKIIFVVNAENVATSHYEPSDSYGIAWRIHTKSDRYAS